MRAESAAARPHKVSKPSPVLYVDSAAYDARFSSPKPNALSSHHKNPRGRPDSKTSVMLRAAPAGRVSWFGTFPRTSGGVVSLLHVWRDGHVALHRVEDLAGLVRGQDGLVGR